MKNNSGQVLIQVIIAIVIFGFLVQGFITTVSSQRKDIKFNQALIARNLLEMRLEKYLGTSASLNFTRKSTANVGNVKFSGCYTASGGLCEAETNPVGFILYDPNGVAVSGASPAAAVKYDSRGDICAQGSNDCVFEVFTAFLATCPGAASSCAAPLSFNATFTIRQIENAKHFGGFSFATLKSAPIPIGAPAYILTNIDREHADGTRTFPIGIHDFCGLARYNYDGDGVGSCLIHGEKKANWTITIVDEGDANTLLCGAVCIDYL